MVDYKEFVENTLRDMYQHERTYIGRSTLRQVAERLGVETMTEKEFEKFRKIPVVIEAYQTDVEMEIETLEGTMKADKGDWIIKGVKGELYPCKNDVFEMTYEKVE